jgi:CMP-N,N'-diacetyllegionaminic acid synthase
MEPPPDSSMNLKILGFVPARGGSKGVPGKNKAAIAGLPLVARSILTAQESGCFDRLWVSTDDPEIAQIAECHGVAVPWLRPKELAQDESSMSSVLAHLIEQLDRNEGYRPDAVMILQPTSPLRQAATIRRAVAMFQANQRETIISVTPARSHPFWCYRIAGDDSALEPFMPGIVTPPPRQHLPEAYELDGSIFLIAVETFLKELSFFSAGARPLIVPRDEAVDVDTPLDWMMAEALLKARDERAQGDRSNLFPQGRAQQ